MAGCELYHADFQLQPQVRDRHYRRLPTYSLSNNAFQAVTLPTSSSTRQSRLIISRSIHSPGGDANRYQPHSQAHNKSPGLGHEKPWPPGELTVVVPIVMDDGDARQYESIRQQPQQEPLRAWEGQAIGAGLPPAGETASGSAGEARLKKGPSPGPPGRWPALVMLPAAIWGVAWASTVGLASICYAALASAAAIAAAAFGSLAPGATAAASRFGIADSNAAAAAAVASVDWVDVALRTAAGLMDGVGGSGRVHILEALQDAGSSPGAAWAVTVVLPGLCALAGGCRAVATAVRTGLPWLEPLAQMAAAAAGLGVLTVLAMPLRRFLAPLVPVLPRERPSGAVSAALRVGGAACMVAVLTALQTRQLAAPPLVPSIRSAVAAAATSSPLLLQTQAVLYGVTASVSDALLPACTAVFAGIAIYALLQRQYAGEAGLKQQLHVRETGAEVLPITSANAPSGQAAGSTDATAAVDRRLAAFGAVRALAACRLVLDALLLVAVAMGVLPGKISAMQLLGMLWLLQIAAQL